LVADDCCVCRLRRIGAVRGNGVSLRLWGDVLMRLLGLIVLVEDGSSSLQTMRVPWYFNSFMSQGESMFSITYFEANVTL